MPESRMDKDKKSTADVFARYQKSATGNMRYVLAQKNMLKLHDLEHPLRILDAAGGNGINTHWLLRQGHSVTLLDSDPEMLEQAQQLLVGQDFENRCRLVHGTIESLTELFPTGTFDLVVCHHVLEYVSNPLQVLTGLSQVTAPSGELSLITLNPVSEVIRAIVFRHDALDACAKLTDLRYDAQWFGAASLYPLEQILDWGEQSGWKLVEFRGIRVLADYIPEAEYTEDKEKQVTRLEEQVAEQEPYRRAGRYLQFCFKKTAVQ